MGPARAVSLRVVAVRAPRARPSKCESCGGKEHKHSSAMVMPRCDGVGQSAVLHTDASCRTVPQHTAVEELIGPHCLGAPCPTLVPAPLDDPALLRPLIGRRSHHPRSGHVLSQTRPPGSTATAPRRRLPPACRRGRWDSRRIRARSTRGSGYSSALSSLYG